MTDGTGNIALPYEQSTDGGTITLASTVNAVPFTGADRTVKLPVGKMLGQICIVINTTTALGTFNITWQNAAGQTNVLPEISDADNTVFKGTPFIFVLTTLGNGTDGTGDKWNGHA